MFFIRSEDTVTVVARGKPYTVANDHPQFADLNAAISADDEDAVYRIVTAVDYLQALVGVFGAVKVYGGRVTVNDEPIHNYLVGRILAAVSAKEDITPLANFLDLVAQNPSRRAVEDLYNWCERAKMPLSPDGHIIAYKMIRQDYTDCHTGTIDNTPGRIVQMPRNQVDDNPERTCSYGLHLCAASYIRGASGRIVLVKVSPADVVAFPVDYQFTKARCCRYEVLQEIPGADFFNDYDGLSWPPELTIEQRLNRVTEKEDIDLSHSGFASQLTYLEGYFGLHSSIDDSDEDRIAAIEEAANV